jgi:oxygen-independent coproporphyrinogen III oxidase
MPGIYLHIPFCRKACHYCDFHFSTNLSPRAEMVEAMLKELEFRKAYLGGQPIETIYFGGGTPSVLSAAELDKLLNKIASLFSLDNPEITLEANPDDLTVEKLTELKNSGINRLSIGLQTFDEETLRFLNRSHTSSLSLQCLDNALSKGFDNITADLIYAIPPEETSLKRFEHDLDRLLSFKIPHISLYGLTIEEKTAFGNWAAKGKLPLVSEESNARQYQLAIDRLTETGFDHYEVSNFGKPGWYSRHNTAYWQDVPYLGIGPGAHSYNGQSRFINKPNNAFYIKMLHEGNLPGETEWLSPTQKLNEYLLTGLRTRWGIDLNKVASVWGKALWDDHANDLNQLVEQGMATHSDSHFCLTSQGYFIADEIALRLLYEE